MTKLTIQQQKRLIILQKELDERIKCYYSQTVNTTYFERYIKVLTYEYTDSKELFFLETIKSSICCYNKGDTKNVVNNEAYKLIHIEEECNIQLLQDLIKFFMEPTFIV